MERTQVVGRGSGRSRAGSGSGSRLDGGFGAGGGSVVGGRSYEVFPPSMTSSVGLPSAEKNRSS